MVPIGGKHSDSVAVILTLLLHLVIKLTNNTKNFSINTLLPVTHLM